MVLENYQSSIGGYVFGRGCVVQIDRLTGLGLGSKDARIFRKPGADGNNFGREYRNGRNITYEGHIQINSGTADEKATAAMTAIIAMQAAWDAHDVRIVPRATVDLRIKWPGFAEAVIAGRPGAFDWDPAQIAIGRVLWSATFDAVAET